MARRCFHAHISGHEAEALLKHSGTDGTFLIRPSQSKPGNFTISVMYQDDVTNITVLNDGDCFQLASLDGSASDPFATLNDLLTHCMETPSAIPLKDGGYIQLKFPLASEDPTSERWFHGSLKGADAEKLLLSKGSIGNFLVRESQSKPGQFVISVRCQSGISHVIVRCSDGKYDVGSGNRFNSLSQLVNYYKENPQLRDAKTHNIINLEEPFYSTSFVARNISERIKQLDKMVNQRATGFADEFERLQYFDMKQAAYSTHEGHRPENKTKNRYKNILPYDHSRVKLRDVNSEDVGADYINANYIDSELKENETRYIAAQGCLPQTINAFWKMVYQENCRIIVMLTNEVERGKAKCARYWPKVGMSAEFDDIVIDNMMENDRGDYLIRELRLYHKETSEEPPRMICHYHFTTWPDHGTPKEPGSVLELLEDIYAMHLRCGKKGPLLFHCSAGIGRTGTVIVIDVLIHLLEEQGLDCEIDIQKTTQLIRLKRPGMIQTQHQYRFLYKAIEMHISKLAAEQENAKKMTSSSDYENLSNVKVNGMPRLQAAKGYTTGSTNEEKKVGASDNKKKSNKKHNTDPGQSLANR